jgi:hypothetical protein
MSTVGFTKLVGAILVACKAVRRATHREVGRKSLIAAAAYFTLLLLFYSFYPTPFTPKAPSPKSVQVETTAFLLWALI